MASLGHNELKLQPHHPEDNELNRISQYMVIRAYFNGLLQEKRNSSALAMELRLSSINPSIYQCYLPILTSVACTSNPIIN